MAVSSRRGQMFLIGTLLFAALITGIVLINQGGSIGFTGSETPKALFDRGMDEYPRALNTVTEVDASPGEVKRRIASYLGFHSYTVRSHGVDSREHAIIAIPNSTGFTAIVGNFRGVEMGDAWMKVDGTGKSLGNVDAGETRLVGFPSTTGDVRVMFNASADRLINNSFTASGDSITSLYTLRVEGENQIWTDTETY